MNSQLHRIKKAAQGMLLLSLAFLAACAGAPERMSPEVGAIIPRDWVAEDRIDGAARKGWLGDFNDPQLSSLVAEALEKNHDLKATAARLATARANSTVAGAGAYPSLDFSGGTSKAQSLSRAPGGTNSDVNGFNRARSTDVGLSFDLAWELDIWGRIRSGQSAAIADVQGAEYNLYGARLSLAGQTAQAWFSAVEAKLQRDLSQETVESFEETTKLVEDRFKTGLSDALDVHVARSDTATARGTLQSREIAYEQALRDLELLLGRYPAATVKVASDLQAVPPQIPAGVPADVLERRPDILSAERNVAANFKRVSAARAARLPRISLTASGGTSSDALRDLIDPKNNVWNLALNMVTPILDGNRLDGELRLAKANQKEAVANYGSTVLRAFSEVEQALASEALLAERETQVTLAADEAWQAFERAREQYSRGIGEILTVLDTQRRALNARSEVLQVKAERLRNRVRLHLALGGDFESLEQPLSPETKNDQVVTTRIKQNATNDNKAPEL